LHKPKLEDILKEARTELHTIRDFVRFATSRFTEANLVFGEHSWDCPSHQVMQDKAPKIPWKMPLTYS
jgi:hypothetical protein